MNRSLGKYETNWRRGVSLVVIAAALACVTGCSTIRMVVGTGAKRPAISEFGLGPRASANKLYAATLEPTKALKPRQMQSVLVKIVDGDGRPVEGARIRIDGGMPQHGHGLPTKPRMTHALAPGTYEIEGVRFNMGGWWEFKVTIVTDRGEDTVTFNLSL
jgi:hypothetical protein